MKSTVEQLTPTRVKLNVEVPFEELSADFDRAYRSLAQQIRIPGFRPGKAPAKSIEARVGRDAILAQVVNEHAFSCSSTPRRSPRPRPRPSASRRSTSVS